MKTTTKVIFASALLLAAAAPTLSHASYFVDQTKTWALEARAQDQMGKVTRHDTAKPQVSKDQASVSATRRCRELVSIRTTAGTRIPNKKAEFVQNVFKLKRPRSTAASKFFNKRSSPSARERSCQYFCLLPLVR